MWTWIKELWTDKDTASICLRSLIMGFAVWASTPKGRSEWERVVPGVAAAVGVALPSSRTKQ